MRRIFLMKAHTAKDLAPGGWFLSEKLDGMRAFWDGGLTRGMPVSGIPWANTERSGADHVSTGLWSNYANVIHAPDWWLDQLPRTMLDGELYGDLPRQEILSKVRSFHGDWTGVQLHVLDMPSMLVFCDGKINLPNYHHTFHNTMEWVKEYGDYSGLEYIVPNCTMFRSVVRIMYQKLRENTILRIHPQKQLPYQTSKALDLVNQSLEEVTERGGEGLVIRKGESYWKPLRSHEVLKIKKLNDAEGRMVGYITGRRTELGSKLLGRMGAMILALESPLRGRLELSGFTDEERRLSEDAKNFATEHPGEEVDGDTIHFKRGELITFRYRGLSKDGIPQEARYWRKRHEI